MQVLSTEMPTWWLDGARREWVTSVIRDPSEAGVVEPVAQQTRPLLRFTVDVDHENGEALENLFIEANGPEKAFLCQCPLERDHYQSAAVTIGTATGSLQSMQLLISRGQTWGMLYPIDGTIIVYSNGTPLVQGVNWTLGALGLIAITSTSGHAITARAKYKTRFGFLENSLTTVLDQGLRQTPQQVSFEEII